MNRPVTRPIHALNDSNNPKKPEDTLVVVGMSGGVDSSVTALLLKNAGYKVVGIFMKNWEELDERGVCKSSLEFKDVERVCFALDIPYYSIDFIQEYRDNVFAHFLQEYELGFTPNPDILCNREIKFNVFLKKAMELGADYLATGHYAQIGVSGPENQREYSLLRGHDHTKDQSYFLYTLKSDILKKVLFPIGHLEKKEVRKIAREFNLATKDKKDSTGICFIGERNFKEFLSQFIQLKTGAFQTLNGEIVGTHSGSAYYTIGQRKGLGLGGAGEPWFVVDKNIEKNIVYVERGDDHPALYAKELWANEISFVRDLSHFAFPLNCTAKIRYRQKDVACTILSLENNMFHVAFDEPQRAITIRQSIVFYLGEECLGGAMIARRGPTLHEQKSN